MAAGSALIDLRDARELEANGRIPGAVHVPRGMLEFRADPTGPYHQEPFDPAKRIIVHCASGGRSALAAATLQDMGYSNVAHLDGGVNAWKEAGKPVVSQVELGGAPERRIARLAGRSPWRPERHP